MLDCCTTTTLRCCCFALLRFFVVAVPNIKNSDEAACLYEIGISERQAEQAARLEKDDLCEKHDARADERMMSGVPKKRGHPDERREFRKAAPEMGMRRNKSLDLELTYRLADCAFSS